MSDSKISDLTAVTTLASDDVLAVVDTSESATRKITKANLKDTLDAEAPNDSTLTLTKGAATAEVAERFGATATEGMELCVINETSAVLNAVSTDLTQDLPDGAVLLGGQINVETAVTGGGTTTKIGLGPVADPDKYGLTSALTKNAKGDLLIAPAVLSGAEDVKINACTDAGAIGDTALTVGTVRIRLYYRQMNSLDDAA